MVARLGGADVQPWLVLLALSCDVTAFSGSTTPTVRVATALQAMVMGDWGGLPVTGYTPGEKAMATALGDQAGKVGASFTLALGDNFYFKGVSSVDDPRFRTTFENVFTSPNLQGDNHFRILAGNHDHYGNVTAQLAYTERSARWHFPSLHYDFVERAPDGSTLQVVMIDTVELVGLADDGFTVDGIHGPRVTSGYSGPADPLRAEMQWDWLNSSLARSTADYLIVAGHYPVWSICEHGPTDGLVDRLKPLLEKYRVTAYLAGHDHCAQYLEDGSGVAYHGIGASNVCDSSKAHSDAVPAGSLKWHYEAGLFGYLKGAFGQLEVSKAGLVVRHYASDGDLIYDAAPKPGRN